MTYFVTDLQAVEPEALEQVEGITVEVEPGLDSMGFPRVTVRGETREGLLAYVARQWGDETGTPSDQDWFDEWVVQRVEQVSETRTVLVHLNVQVPGTDDRDADAIADAVMAALEVGSDDESVADLKVVCPMAEEV
jgi:hypothetical protein